VSFNPLLMLPPEEFRERELCAELRRLKVDPVQVLEKAAEKARKRAETAARRSAERSERAAAKTRKVRGSIALSLKGCSRRSAGVPL
jgi:hypothetical protein